MPDIFGREPFDYEHIRKAVDAFGQDAYRSSMQERARTRGIPPHNFDALTEFRHRNVTDAEANAQAVSFVTNNLQAIQSMIEEILYTEFRLDEFIPIKTDIPEGATTYAYRVIDRFGEGRFIESDGTDAPSAEVTQRLINYPIEYAGIIPKWSVHDLRRAMYAGVPLDSELIEAATVGAMNHIEQVGLKGADLHGFKGLTNLSGPTVTAGTDLSGISGGQALLEYLQGITTDLITSTKEVFGRTIRRGFTIWLPIEQAALITDTRMTDGNDLTVWDFYKSHNAWHSYTGEQPTLKWVQELEDGAANGSSDRMIVGINDARIMEMAMPISPRVVRTVSEAFTVSAPIEYTISGLNLKRPAGIRYYDGV